MGISAPILDGNVKRVLSRVYAVEGWYGQSPVLKQLWNLSKQLTPGHRAGDFNQAMMDLGALVCTRSKPDCDNCPLNTLCQARASNQQSVFPHKKPKIEKPSKSCWMLIAKCKHEVKLEKRPSIGLWGGLYGFPQFDSLTELEIHANNSFRKISQQDKLKLESTPSFRHTFTHFHLTINPVIIRLNHRRAEIHADDGQIWYNLKQPPSVGLAAPVKKLLQGLT